MSETQLFGGNLLAALGEQPENLSGLGVAWIDDRRRRALAAFRDRGLPHPREEAWRYTNVTPLTRTAFVPTTSALSAEQQELVASRAEAACAGLEEVETHIFVNGCHTGGPKLPAGAAVSIRTTLAESPGMLEPYLGHSVNESLNGFSALNTAFFDDGAFIHVAPAQPAHTVHLVHVAAGDEAGLSFARNVIVLEPQAHATVIETYVSTGNAAHLCTAGTEIVLGEGALLEHYRMQSMSAEASHVGAVEASIGTAATYRAHHVSIGGKLSRVDANVALDAERAACELNGLYVVTGRQHSDIHTRIQHRYPDGRSDELFKGILDDYGRGVFNGLVEVCPDAQRTDSTQANHNLLLSENAEIDTKPELQIFADDVKCAHGATVGQLDDDMVFYLRSRGLDESQARATLTYAFAEEVVHRMSMPAVRHQVIESLNRALPQAAELVPSEILFEQ